MERPSRQRRADLQADFDRLTSPYGDASLAAANAQLGETPIDIGCGCGDTALKLAAYVGPSGAVFGDDISKAMVAVAARRAKQAGTGHATFAKADEPHTAADGSVSLTGSTWNRHRESVLKPRPPRHMSPAHRCHSTKSAWPVFRSTPRAPKSRPQQIERKTTFGKKAELASPNVQTHHSRSLSPRSRTPLGPGPEPSKP